MKDKQLSKESTVYHYRLLQRIHYKPLYFQLYWGLLGLVFVWDLIRLQPFPLLLGLLLIPNLHTLLIYLYFKFKEKRPLKQWMFQYRLPWIGYVPTSYFALYRMMHLHIHLLWVTIVICCCFYPWVSINLIAHVIFVHLWVIAPRLFILFQLRKHAESGYLKLNEQDTSCYAQ
ncbi:hypothetical protein SK3146_04137 [Paenibacillus konkukensis]|uniref:Transposase n=1 Tax=Paenibacillus konkukensis TaxID=2020716 RepID=A0ABY4RQU5_9BACL|nr:hypothetical protein [Paenibacillus konkukensis]UQZ84876.1 hypothetical protein SK3146_04137 [Paenibacillus konkukensis]